VGSIAYPVAVYGCYLAYHHYYHQYIYFYLPILILAICDPLAALTGKTWPKGKFRAGSGYKTLVGSLMFFFSAALLCVLLFVKLTMAQDISYILTGAIMIGAMTSVTEALSRKGYDNITIPASALAALILFYHFFGNGGSE
jgi:phytol kinase